MKSICITGLLQPQLNLVESLLQQAGVAAALPAKRDETFDITAWHEQLLGQLADEDDDIVESLSDQPGRLWEQLASDIFLANMKSGVWCWANSRSIDLLNFWLGFESRLNFVLVYASPEQFLAQAIASNADIESVEALMETWLARHQAMLRFHNSNPRRILLVDIDDIVLHPAAFVAACKKKWRLPLTVPELQALPGTEQNPFTVYLARQILAAHPQIVDLQQEFAARIKYLDKAGPQEASELAPTSLIASFRELADRSSEQQKLEKLETELAALSAAYKEASTLLEAKGKELQTKLQESEQENALVLVQLHQVQEELEAIFLKSDRDKTQLDSLKQTVAAVEKEKLVLTGQRDSLHKELAAVTQKMNQAIEGLAQANKARDEQAKLASERQKQVDTLQQKATALEKEVTSLRARPVAPPENKAQAEALTSAQNRLKEAEQENELLLLQLHQVQEELEHYFLQHQDVQKQLKAADARWQRVVQRVPNYHDYAALSVLAMDASGNGTWRIQDLVAGGRSFAELQFDTLMENGFAGLVFKRAADGSTPILHWPAESGDVLPLLPVSRGSEVAQRLKSFVELSSSDWDLLKTLLQLLANALEAPAKINAPTELPALELRNGLLNFIQMLERFPPILRYDHVSLEREQVNPDYEHLWLRLRNVAFGSERWPDFEFRISCAHVRPDYFGSNPKLEFPEAGSKELFGSWFVEAYDDFGPKLELRFAQPASLDITVWSRLSTHDRSFVHALLQRLPSILRTLQAVNTQLKRSWDDWHKLVNDMMLIVQQHSTSIASESQPVPNHHLDENPGPVAESKVLPHPATKAKAKTVHSPRGTSKTP
jgi:hypothetical protein